MNLFDCFGLFCSAFAVTFQTVEFLRTAGHHAKATQGMNDVFDNPQGELILVDEDRQFGICGKGCPDHGTAPFLQRKNFDGVNYYRAKCVFVGCPYTGEWHKTREKAKRLWNLQVILSKP